MNILKFFGSWCNPCKTLNKSFKDAGIEYTSIDVDDNEELVDKYNVTSVPTVIVLDENGEEIGRFVGARSKDQLINELQQYTQK